MRRGSAAARLRRRTYRATIAPNTRIAGARISTGVHTGSPSVSTPARLTSARIPTLLQRWMAIGTKRLSVASAATAKNVFFAKVSYSTASPVVVSGTPGIAGDGEQFAGAPRLTFPRNMESCAVTAILDNSGTDGIARRSDLSEGARVVLVLRDQASALIRSGYNVVAICP